MAFTLPDLPYAFDALEPHIDARTMEIHHDKHHATYVNNLNAAIGDNSELTGRSVEDLVSNLDSVPEAIRSAVRNNGGGHLNHSMFWQLMQGSGQSSPTGDLAAAIDSTFGSLGGFKESLKKAALSRFGSGWAWLSVDGEGGLIVESTANQDNPVSHGNTPILGIDVWEHAYYLHYQNRRPDYVDAWQNVVDWNAAAELFSAAGAR